MFLLWLVQLRTHNAGIVDCAWPFLTAATATWLILASHAEPGARQWLLIAFSIAWGVRLGTYLLKRVLRETEDGRYRYLREYCGNYAPAAFFIFFQLQVLFVLLFATPIWAASLNTSESLTWLDALGVLLWFLAMAGEWLSDNQLAHFKSRVKDSSLVCDEGLWAYTRHPNYFFEWSHWWAYVLIGLGGELWWLCLGGPVLMYVFIIYLTGVPYTEQQSLRSKGTAYQAYQSTTPMFFPALPIINRDASSSRTGGIQDV